MQKKVALELLQKVRDDYQTIAEHFSQTRFAPWPEFTSFKRYVHPGARVLDAGCGNGRLLDLFNDVPIEYHGLDASSRLIRLAREKHPNQEFLLGDLISLPFPDRAFDVIFCLATLHHIPSDALRQSVIQEFRRVLKDHGIVILTVWNFWQRKFLPRLFQYTMFKLLGKNKLDFKDLLIPWKNQAGEIVVERYVHAFSLAELERLLERNGFRVIEAFYSRQNQRATWLSGYNLNVVARVGAAGENLV